MVASKGTDKLRLLTEAAQEAVRRDPALLDKLAEVKLTWREPHSSDAGPLPEVCIRFK
uniref:Uncharacterized protein n=1 Tax=Pseudomonas phage RVTF4 TaxID=3236931 RepID=A0AB39CD55_9VIRU